MADKPWIPDDWTFRNAGVASRFDDHVRETLPWYDLATHGVAHFLRAYVPEGGLVYDVGASTGNVARSVAETIESRSLRFVGIEPSKQMVDIYDAPGEIVCANAEEFPFEEFDVAVLFLVLMFIPVAERRPLLDRLKERLRPGGAILVVDKFPLPAGYLGSSMYRWTLKQKQSGGISMEEIAEKELSLVGRQRPVVPGLFDGFVEWLRVGEFRGLIYTGADT